MPKGCFGSCRGVTRTTGDEGFEAVGLEGLEIHGFGLRAKGLGSRVAQDFFKSKVGSMGNPSCVKVELP